jgi:hypothetical protein
MSDSSQKSWSDNPNAPQIPYDLYFREKATFAGEIIGAIFYGLSTDMPIFLSLLALFVRFIVPGIVIVLFFQCMAALFDPANRKREGMRWGFVLFTAAMFSFVTIFTAMSSNILSICFVDNREFPGVGDKLPPGPIGYQFSIYSKAISIIPNLMFLLNNWLADGLLVAFLPDSLALGSHISYSSSSIVVTLSIL